MLYCSAHRIESCACRLRTIDVRAPARFSARSANTNANAPSLKINVCGEVCAAIVADVMPVAPLNKSGAELAGEAVTVWSGPLVMIDGVIGKVAVVVPEISAVIVNGWRN